MKTILKSALSVFAVAMFVCAMVTIFLSDSTMKHTRQ